MKRTKPTALTRKLAAGFVRRAAETDSALLAGPLLRYAEAEGLGWDELASRLAITVEGLDRVAMCFPPRPERFVEDTEEIAGAGADLQPLLNLFRHLQVLGAFLRLSPVPVHPSGRASQEGRFGGVLAAARDLRLCEEVIDYSIPPEERETEPPERPEESESEGE